LNCYDQKTLKMPDAIKAGALCAGNYRRSEKPQTTCDKVLTEWKVTKLWDPSNTTKMAKLSCLGRINDALILQKNPLPKATLALHCWVITVYPAPM
jgi:hypothetical protein